MMITKPETNASHIYSAKCDNLQKWTELKSQKATTKRSTQNDGNKQKLTEKWLKTMQRARVMCDLYCQNPFHAQGGAKRRIGT